MEKKASELELARFLYVEYEYIKKIIKPYFDFFLDF